MSNSQQEITELLNLANQADQRAQEKLFGLLQEELRNIASAYMRTERADHTLQTTVLIDDAFLKLLGSPDQVCWESRTHFYRAAAKAMRRLLIDHHRHRQAEKRGGDYQRAEQEPTELGAAPYSLDLLALDEALNKLAELDPRAAEMVQLHHFGGYSLADTARLLGVSRSTVRDKWTFAKAWLHRELSRDDPFPSSK